MPYEKLNGIENIFFICRSCSFYCGRICYCLAKNFNSCHVLTDGHKGYWTKYVYDFGPTNFIYIRWTREKLESEKSNFNSDHFLLKEPVIQNKSTSKRKPAAHENQSPSKSNASDSPTTNQNQYTDSPNAEKLFLTNADIDARIKKRKLNNEFDIITIKHVCFRSLTAVTGGFKAGELSMIAAYRL